MGSALVPVIALGVAVVVAACHPAPAPAPAPLTSPPTDEAAAEGQPGATPGSDTRSESTALPLASSAPESLESPPPEQGPPEVELRDACGPSFLAQEIGTKSLPASMKSCSANSECVLVYETCCPCGAGARPSTAVNSRAVAAHGRRVCGAPQPKPCPACMPAPRSHLLATCEAGQCTVVDTSRSPLTECSDHKDCRLRTKDCCESGASTDFRSFAAVRSDREADFSAYRCDPGTICPKGEPVRSDRGGARCECNRCVFKW